MKTKPLFPSIRALCSALVAEQRSLRRSVHRAELVDCTDGETPGTDCRLRILPNGNGWQLLTGLSDYDQDHRGLWGASFLPYDRSNLTELARDLIEQCRESEAMQSEGEGAQ